MSGFNGARFTSCCSSVQLKRVWQGLSGKHSSHRRANEGARAPRPPRHWSTGPQPERQVPTEGLALRCTPKRPPRAPGRTRRDLIKGYGYMYVNFYHSSFYIYSTVWIGRRVPLAYLTQSSKNASCFPYSRKTSFRRQTEVRGQRSRIYTLHTES